MQTIYTTETILHGYNHSITNYQLLNALQKPGSILRSILFTDREPTDREPSDDPCFKKEVSCPLNSGRQRRQDNGTDPCNVGE